MIRPIATGAVLALLSALIHAFGLLGRLYRQSRQWPRIEKNFGPRRILPTFLLLFGVIFVLHLVEICLWAGLYGWQRWLPDSDTSLHFSAANYSTAGHVDIAPPRLWQLLGALESLTDNCCWDRGSLLLQYCSLDLRDPCLPLAAERSIALARWIRSVATIRFQPVGHFARTRHIAQASSSPLSVAGAAVEGR